MLSLIIPTFNERGNLEALLRRIEGALAGAEYEVIIVDDGSPDGTAAAVREAQQRRAWLGLIERREGRDLSRAVVEGWRAGRGELLGCMDADLQHPPEVLPQLLAALTRPGVAVAVASRYVSGGEVGRFHAARHLGSKVITALTGWLLPGALGGVSDPMSGFFIMRREAVALEALRPRGYKILLEVLARCQPWQAVEVPFTFASRGSGASKANARVGWEFVRQMAALRWSRRNRIRKPGSGGAKG